MNDKRNNIDPERNKEDLKEWIESHLREYGEIALEMVGGKQCSRHDFDQLS